MRFQRLVKPYPSGPLRLDGRDLEIQDVWAKESTAISGVEVEYWALREHTAAQRDPLYGESLKREFAGPYKLFAHVDAPDAIPEVREEGYRAAWTAAAWIARKAWEDSGAAEGGYAPSEGDVLGFWRSAFFDHNEAQQGDNLPGERFYFSITNVSDAGHLFTDVAFVGIALNLTRVTNFAPERRIDVRR